MAIPISNVSTVTDTFADWLEKTNQVLDIITTKTVTTESNTTGGLTTGNAYVNGVFSANVLTAVQSIRGGTVDIPDVLYISSNAAFINSSANVFVLTTNSSASVLVSNIATVNINSINTNITTGVLTISANISTTSNSVTLNNNLTTISGNSLVISTNTNINANLNLNTSLISLNSSTLEIKGGNVSVTSNSSLQGLVTIEGGLTVSSNSLFTEVAEFRKTLNVQANAVLSNGVVTITSNVSSTANSFSLNNDETSITGNSLSVNTVATFNQNTIFQSNTSFTGNSSFTSSTLDINTNSTNISGNGLSVQTNTILSFANLTVNTSSQATVNTPLFNLSGGSANVTSNVEIDNAIVDINSNTSISINTLSLSVSGGSANITSNVDVQADFNVNGNFSSNGVLVTVNTANLAVSGGNTQITSNLFLNSANLTINTGTLVSVNTANLVISGGNSNITSNVLINNANLYVNSTALVLNSPSISIDGGNVQSSSNIYFNNANLTINSIAAVINTSTLSLRGGNTTVESNAFLNNANLTVNSTAITINSASFSVGGGNTAFNGNTTFSANVSVTANFDVQSDVTFDGGNTTFGSSALFVDNSTNRVSVGSTDTSNALNVLSVTGNVLFSSNLYVSDSVITDFIRATDFEVTGNLTYSGTTTGSIIPGTNSFSLGNNTNRWAVYGSTGQFSDDVVVSGNLTVSNFSSLNKNTTIGSASQKQFTANSTNVNLTDDYITLAAHGLSNGDMVVYFTGSGNTVITGLTNNETYFVVGANATTFKLSSSLGGSAVNLTSVETGDGHFINRNQISLQTEKITIGNTSVNTSISPYGIETDGTLNVSGVTIISNEFNAGNTDIIGDLFVSGNTLSNGVFRTANNLIANGQLIVVNTASVGNTTVSGFVNTTSQSTVGTQRATVTFNALSNVSTASNTITITAHSFVNNDVVTYFVDAGNTAIGGLSNNTSYFVRNTTTDTFELASTLGGSAIDITAGAISESGHSFVTLSSSITPLRISVGNSTVNTFITPLSIETDGSLSVTGTTSLSGNTSAGNTSVTGFINVTSTANIGGVLNARANAIVNGQLVVANTVDVGNSSITGFINVSTTANIGGVLNARANAVVNGQLTVANTIDVGNTSVTGFINVSTTANIGGVLNARANAIVNGQLVVANTVDLGNTSVTGFINVSTTASISGVTTVSNNLNVSGISNVTSVSKVGSERTNLSFNAQSNVSTVGNTVTISSHGLVNNDVVTYFVSSGNTAVPGLTNNTSYYVRNTTTDTFSLSDTFDGAVKDINSGSVSEIGHTFVLYGATITPALISIGNSTVNSSISPSSISVDGTLSAGNTSLDGTLSTGNTTITGTVSSGNSTVTGFANITSTLAAGNTTVTGFINVSSTADVGGVLSARANTVVNGELIVVNSASLGNTTITGFANITSTLTSGNSSVSGSMNVSSISSVGRISSTLTFNAQQNVSSAAETITISSHGLSNGDSVTYYVAAGNTAIGGLSNNSSYFVRDTTTDTFKLSDSFGGSVLNITSGSTSETGHTFVFYRTDIIPSRISVGNSTINSFVSPFSIQTPLLSVGSNVQANVSSVFIGNSSQNTIILNNQIKIGNNTVNSDLNNGVLNIGSNVSLNVSALKIGNSTVNVIITANGIQGSAGVFEGNSLSISTLSVANVISVGNTACTESVSLVANVTDSDSTTKITFGNSTVFASLNSTSLSVQNISANVSGNGINLTSVNALTVGGNTALTLRQYSETVVSAINVLAGTGLTGGGALSANVTLGLTGQSLALHNLSTTGYVTRTGTGTFATRTLVGGSGITITNGDGLGGNTTISASGASDNVQFKSLFIGPPAGSPTYGSDGDIRATGDIVSGYSDERLKDIVGKIPDALNKVNNISGYYYRVNDIAKELGFENPDLQVGVIAQKVQQVLPEVVKPAPINSEYLTVQYDRLIPLLIEAIKELNNKVEELKERINKNGSES